MKLVVYLDCFRDLGSNTHHGYSWMQVHVQYFDHQRNTLLFGFLFNIKLCIEQYMKPIFKKVLMITKLGEAHRI